MNTENACLPKYLTARHNFKMPFHFDFVNNQCCQIWRLSSETAGAPKVAIPGNFGGNLTNHLVTLIIDKIGKKWQFKIMAGCQILLEIYIFCIHYLN